MSRKSIRKIQAEGIAMMRAGLNKLPPNFNAPAPKTTPRPRGLRRKRIHRLYEMQNGLCYLCGELMTIGGPKLQQTDATIDHYIARSRGGSNAMSNLRAACYACNHAKGSRIVRPSEPQQELVALC